MKSTDNPTAAVSIADLAQLTDTELSMAARLGYVALLLVGLAAAAVIGSLWLTEPSLPLRTHLAFAVMVAIGLAWAMFAARVLTSKRTLLARHRVVAARMSVAFTGTFLIAALTIAHVQHSAAAWAAASMAATMLTAAVGMLFHANRRFAELMQRRQNLAQQLGRAAH